MIVGTAGVLIVPVTTGFDSELKASTAGGFKNLKKDAEVAGADAGLGLRTGATKETGELKDGYGFGWACGDGWCGHGGAYSTNMTVDYQHGLVTVFMVQHAGFPGEGGKSHDAFRKAALDTFAK